MHLKASIETNVTYTTENGVGVFVWVWVSVWVWGECTCMFGSETSVLDFEQDVVGIISPYRQG